MSGHKEATITITEEEYRRLHEVDMRARFMHEDYPKLVEDATRATRQSLDRDYEAFQSRQQQLLDTVGEVSGNLVELESFTQQALVAYQAQIQDDMNHLAGTLWDQTDHLAKHLFEAHKKVEQELYHQTQEQFRQFAHSMRKQADGERAKQSLARDWIDAGMALVAFIQANYPHDHFQPGRLDGIENRLLQADQNQEQGLHEAAISQAQDAYLQLAEMRLSCETAWSEYRFLQQACREQVKVLLRMTQGSAHIPAINLANQELGVNLDVDYWTQGGIRAMLQELRQIGRSIDRGLEVYSVENLRELYEQVLPEKQHALSDLVGDARMAALSSQLRLNIADIVVRALFGQGYALTEASYSGSEKDGFFARVIDRSGSEIVVQVDPEGAATPENRLHLIASDRQPRTQHELRQRAREIQRSLQQTGLLVSNLVAVDERTPYTAQRMENRSPRQAAETRGTYRTQEAQLPNDR